MTAHISPSKESNRANRFAVALAFFVAASIPLKPAFADVIDVGSDGTITVHNTPGIFNVDGSHSIVPGQSSRRKFLASTSMPNLVSTMITYAAGRYNISADLLQRVAWQESRFHYDAVSPEGAVGIMQLMDGTARDLGVNRFDPSQNILGGAAYLRQMLDRYAGNQTLALAAYNAGPGAVDHYGGIPPYAETLKYVKNIGSSPMQAFQFQPPTVIFVGP